jgi:hypothetical protein
MSKYITFEEYLYKQKEGVDLIEAIKYATNIENPIDENIFMNDMTLED